MTDRPRGNGATGRGQDADGPDERCPERRQLNRIGELRRAQPADSTTKNLLAVINAKLDLCAHLPVFEWEAVNEGHERSAAIFHELSETEGRSCAELLDRLQAHLRRPARCDS
jgi:hypothetical protein